MDGSVRGRPAAGPQTPLRNLNRAPGTPMHVYLHTPQTACSKENVRSPLVAFSLPPALPASPPSKTSDVSPVKKVEGAHRTTCDPPSTSYVPQTPARVTLTPTPHMLRTPTHVFTPHMRTPGTPCIAPYALGVGSPGAPIALTPHQPIVLRTPIKPDARRKTQELIDEAVAAVEEGSVDMLLCAWRRDRDQVFPVHDAIRRRNVGALELLLEQSSYGPNEVSEVFGCKLTPLQLCLGLYGPEVSQCSQADTQNRHFARLPRGLCFTREQYGLVELLLKHAADANISGPSGVTPLLASVRNLHPQLVDLLLQAGAKPNVAGITGQGPLHVAAIFSNCGPEAGKEIVKSLLDARADPTLTCERGCVPRDYSVDVEVRAILESEELWWRRRNLAWIRSRGQSFVGKLPRSLCLLVARNL